MYNKKIMIIGAGISGLRAALFLAENSEAKITILDKSSSVGGRVATRRLGELYVNHGCQQFDHLQRVTLTDPLPLLKEKDYFKQRATDLPKRLRDEILSKYSKKVEFKFNFEVKNITNQKVISINDEHQNFDIVLVTAPIPQAEKMLGITLPHQVEYQKSILFIGVINNEVIRLNMDDKWSEEMFDLDEVLLRQEAQKLTELPIHLLSIKKWKFAQVRKGIFSSHLNIDQNTYLAGDAFDTEGDFDLASSWLSGLSAAKDILEEKLKL